MSIKQVKHDMDNYTQGYGKGKADGYAAAITDAIEIVSTASCDYEGQSKCIEKLEALLVKGTK